MSAKELWFLLGFVVFWIVLNRWVLPWFGVSTCMFGACGVERPPVVSEELPEHVQQEGDTQ